MRKTDHLFAKYSTFLTEADEDATDATDITDMDLEVDDGVEDLTSEGEKYLVELLVKAFLHEPDESDAATAKELQTQLETDPKAVAATISNLVEIGPEGGIKDDLAQI